MEVHHHTHHPKKWREYFWEFFMLFLAVFCGFLAEYQLEHKIERDRSKELAKSLYEELDSDIKRLGKTIELRKEKIYAVEYLEKYFKDSSLIKPTDSLFRYWAFGYLQTGGGAVFDPSDGVLNQLNNSGSRRYFKEQSLQDAIGKLQVSINSLRIRNDREFAYISTNLRVFNLKHFDYIWMKELMNGGQRSLIEAYSDPSIKVTKNPIISKVNEFDKQEAVNLAGNMWLFLIGTNLTTYRDYEVKAQKVLIELRKNYHIE